MFDRILTPLDGSESSERVLAWVGPLAERLDAGLVLMTAVEADPAPPATVSAARPARPDVVATLEVRRAMHDRLVTAATRYLEATVRRNVPAPVETSFRVAAGKPEDTIVEEAIAAGADLIAMATHRASPIARGVLGSVADRVVHASPIPILLVRPGGGRLTVTSPQTITNVIVPLDGSPESEKALEAGIAMALVNDARLHLLKATAGVHIEGPSLDSPYGHLYTGGQLRDEARDYLEQFVQEALDEGVDAQAVAVTDNPTRAIIRAAHGQTGTMVVMASHGLSGFRRWLLGSITDGVVRGAECPVLVIPVGEGNEPGKRD